MESGSAKVYFGSPRNALESRICEVQPAVHRELLINPESMEDVSFVVRHKALGCQRARQKAADRNLARLVCYRLIPKSNHVSKIFRFTPAVSEQEDKQLNNPFELVTMEN
jgi:hypothetical protein